MIRPCACNQYADAPHRPTCSAVGHWFMLWTEIWTPVGIRVRTDPDEQERGS